MEGGRSKFDDSSGGVEECGGVLGGPLGRECILELALIKVQHTELEEKSQ